MTQVLRETRTVERGDTQVEPAVPANDVAVRIVYLIVGIINTLLGIRFVFVLLGANSSNGIANFVYSVTQPLLAPFFGLFNYKAVYGTVRFEFETLVAMAFYSLIAWIIARVLTLNSNHPVE